MRLFRKHLGEIYHTDYRCIGFRSTWDSVNPFLPKVDFLFLRLTRKITIGDLEALRNH